MTAFPIDPRLMPFLGRGGGWFRPRRGFEPVAVDPRHAILRTDWGVARKTWSGRIALSLCGRNGVVRTRGDVVRELRAILGAKRPPMRSGGAFLVQGGEYVRLRAGRTLASEGLQLFLINVEQQRVSSFRNGLVRVGTALLRRLDLSECVFLELQRAGVPQLQRRIAP